MSPKPKKAKRPLARRQTPQAKPREKLVDVLLTSFREMALRKSTLARTGLSHQEIEAQLLSPGVHTEQYKGIAAGLQEHAARIVFRILEAGEAKEAWASKLILELAGIPQALQAALGAAEAPAPETELMSTLEKSLVENLLALLRGAYGERTAVHSDSE